MTMKNEAVCKVTKSAFSIEGKEVFLYSGEMHYFRIPRRYWSKHFEALKEAGCQAVSAYIPWSWHEVDEGKYDFTGKTHPERDLKGFIREAAAHDLYLTLKPGPYALAELTDQGMPLWVTRKYPETLALGEDGYPWGEAFISYYSDKFRAIAERWLKKICKDVLLPAQNKGQLIMVQLCNEIGMFHWLRGGGDYSVAGLLAWQDYLKQRFPDMQDLAALLDRDVNSYADVAPPKEKCVSRRDFVLYSLWADFHRWLYADYVDFLMRVFDEAKITVPRFTNVGGWVYGRGHEIPLNGTFQHTASQRHKDIIFGIDHIPEFIAPNNLHDAVVANQVCVELQHNKGPLYSAEFQCGSREFGVQTYPGELALFYRFCIAHGLDGINYYMFSQGQNPKGRGTDGPTFYWYNAVNYKGEKQPTFPVVKQLGQWLQTNGETVVKSKKPADFGVAFYPEQHKTEFLTPILHKVHKIDNGKVGFQVDRNQLRDRCWFDSLLRTVNRESCTYDLPDIQLRSAKALSQYKRLVVACDDIMDLETQQKLIDYVDQGGCLIMFPILPRFDLELNNCNLMEQAFGITRGSHSSSNRITVGKLKDLPVMYGPFEVNAPKARTIATDENKRPVAVEIEFGKGRVRFMSFFLGFHIEEHPLMWRSLLELDEARKTASTNHDGLHVSARYHAKEALVFVGNFHRMPITGKVTVNMPGGKKAVDLGSIEMPSQTGLILPVNHVVSPEITIDYAHAELVEKQLSRECVLLTLCGAAHTRGCIVMSCKKPIVSAKLDGEEIVPEVTGKTATFKYPQHGENQYLEIDF